MNITLSIQGNRFGAIKETVKGFYWIGFNRAGRPVESIEKAIAGARRAFGKNIQAYNEDTFELV